MDWLCGLVPVLSWFLGLVGFASIKVLRIVGVPGTKLDYSPATWRSGKIIQLKKHILAEIWKISSQAVTVRLRGKLLEPCGNPISNLSEIYTNFQHQT